VAWVGDVTLRYAPAPGSPAVRVRISEIDNYTGDGPPVVVDTNLRRPFVCHIPII
jgi:hypothetical protein